MWRRADIAFGLVLYGVSCQCCALAWPFVVIKGKCVQLNSISILECIKSLVYRGSRRVKTIDSTISIAFYFSSLLQTRFQKSWDTVQIVNKKGMQ